MTATFALGLLLSACASLPVALMVGLPPRPVPTAQKEVLQPIPSADYPFNAARAKHRL